MVLEGFRLVEKEIIVNYHFPVEEVLKRESEIAARKKSLARAIALGNLEHQKVRIYFADDKGENMLKQQFGVLQIMKSY